MSRAVLLHRIPSNRFYADNIFTELIAIARSTTHYALPVVSTLLSPCAFVGMLALLFGIPSLPNRDLSILTLNLQIYSQIHSFLGASVSGP